MSRDVLDVARAELGTTESPAGSNRTKYGKWMGLDGQPWCMSFVQWCFAQAGQALPCKTGSCSALLRWYQANQPDRVTQTPQPGDIVIYSFGHTGIVESVAGNIATVIEGNTSPGAAGSQDNGGGVYRRTRGRSTVTAYIRPMGNEKEETMTGEEIYNALQAYLKTQPLPEWAREELEDAMQLGITDGESPMLLIPRYQAAIMAKRAAEHAIMAKRAAEQK